MYSGIPKFPLEVDLNDNMKLLEVEYGLKGFAIVIKLFQYIYNKGYYTKWDIDVGFLFIKDMCPQEGWNLVSEVVDCAIRRDIFDKGMYEKYNILTSSRIQNTFLEVAKRRKEVELVKEYLLPVAYNFVNDVNISSRFVYKNTENASTILQGKERKGKESKRRGEHGAPAPTATAPPSFEDVESYCREKGLKVNPKRFYDYYSAGGWVDSRGNKVKNWKQKLLTWNNREVDKNESKAADKPIKRTNYDAEYEH